MIYLHRANFQTETNDAIGPFEFAQVTYNVHLRVDDDRYIATFYDGFWAFDDGTIWTDVTISTAPPDPV